MMIVIDVFHMFLHLVLKEFTVNASDEGEQFLLSANDTKITVDLPPDIENGK